MTRYKALPDNEKELVLSPLQRRLQEEKKGQKTLRKRVLRGPNLVWSIAKLYVRTESHLLFSIACRRKRRDRKHQGECLEDLTYLG